jgi:hypothetical protein
MSESESFLAQTRGAAGDSTHLLNRPGTSGSNANVGTFNTSITGFSSSAGNTSHKQY